MLFGTAGWDYADWAGIVYPPGRGVDRLRATARFVDLLEVNATFYTVPGHRTVSSWLERGRDAGVRFSIKAPRRLTHEEHEPLDRELATLFRERIVPLQDAGLLVAVLLQFPHRFHHERASAARVARLVELLEGLPLVVEFRHRSWLTDRVLSWCERHRVAFCNIDQPSFPGTLPPTAIRTAPLGYVRLHGRNRATWFARLDDRDRRYDYLYTDEDLRGWADRIRRIADGAEEVAIVANNHFRAQALAAIVRLRLLLGERDVPIPAPLLEVDPGLADLPVRPVPP